MKIGFSDSTWTVYGSTSNTANTTYTLDWASTDSMPYWNCQWDATTSSWEYREELRRVVIGDFPAHLKAQYEELMERLGVWRIDAWLAGEFEIPGNVEVWKLDTFLTILRNQVNEEGKRLVDEFAKVALLS